MNPPRCKTRRRLNALSVAKMIRAMQEGPSTVHELIEISGLSLFTTRHYVLTLHREQACHIAHWEQDSRGHYSTPAYAMGEGKDAKKPKRITGAQRSKIYRQRVKQLETLRALAGSESSQRHG